MHRTSVTQIGLAVVMVTFAAGGAFARDPLHYTVSAPRPSSHLIQVGVSVPAEYGCPDVAFSVWTPGGYVLRQRAANVLDAAFTAADGTVLSAGKTDLSTWRPACGEHRGYSVRFRVDAVAAKTPYSAHLDDGLLFANGVTVLPYLPAHQDAPAFLEIAEPPGWLEVCSLPSSNGNGTYKAPDWDGLADAIFAAAPNLTTRSFSSGGAAFTVAYTRRPDPAVELDTVVDAHRKLAEAAARTFGSLPFPTYLFLYKVGPVGAHGGLEHSFGTAMGIPEASLAATGKLLDHMGLAAHEFVHAWNVKRARPAQLRPYDYAHPQLTDLLWVAEGWTSYFGPLLLVRAGIDTPEEYYTSLSNRLRSHRANPGNRFRSLADFSRDSWLKGSIPFISFRSYYTKGSLSGLDLDLRIRAASSGEHTLDDLMRALLTDARLAHTGYTVADLELLASQLAGRPMAGWFQRVVKAPGYIDLVPALATVGLRLELDPEHPLAAFTGIRLEDAEQGPGAPIRWVEPDSPAEAAGLGQADTLLAVAGRTGDRKELQRVIDGLNAGSQVRMTILRGDNVLELAVTPAEPDPLRIPVGVVEDPEAPATAVAARRAWLWQRR